MSDKWNAIYEATGRARGLQAAASALLDAGVYGKHLQLVLDLAAQAWRDVDALLPARLRRSADSAA